MADETTDIQEEQSEETITTQEAITIFFEDILPLDIAGRRHRTDLTTEAEA